MQNAMPMRGTDAVNGLLLVDKPAGITSHDVVARVRRAARTKRVGHAGTLDPFATGLLVVAVGPCTRLLPYLDAEPKLYQANIRFGAETDSDDVTGTVTRFEPFTNWSVLPAAVEALTGTFPQVPPSFSAKHVDGQRAYALARRGDVVSLPPSPVTVHEWIWRMVGGDVVQASISCTGGTYVRALARDLGRAVGSAAHCLSLRRVMSGACHLRDAVPYRLLEPGHVADGAIALRPPLAALKRMAIEVLDEHGLERLRHGRTVIGSQEGATAALVDQQHNVLAIAERNASGAWQPRIVLFGPDDT